jgi:hypothetical protein
MADGGAKAISTIAPGDEVIATEPLTGATTGQKVTAVHINNDTDLTDLSIKTPNGRVETFHTTQNHPFWDVTKRAWVPAGQLQDHDVLAAPGGANATVANIHNFTAQHTMYNLTIADIHTYYVVAGTTVVLVHNDSGLTPAEQAMANQARAIYGSGDFAKIRAAYAGGYEETINVNGYMVQYEPKLPGSGFSVRPNAGGDPVGMMLGPEAFASETELQKTIHHEMFRITEDYIGRFGYSAAVGKAETEDAFNFAERAVGGC